MIDRADTPDDTAPAAPATAEAPATAPADTVWRRIPDSSDLREPRTFVRVFVGPGSLENTVAFYEDLTGIKRDMWFTYHEMGLALAAVGGFLIIEGADDAVAPFRATHGTLLVDSTDAYLAKLVAAGAQIVDPLRTVPSGAGFTARHPDGTVIEYVQHRPTADGS